MILPPGIHSCVITSPGVRPELIDSFLRKRIGQNYRVSPSRFVSKITVDSTRILSPPAPSLPPQLLWGKPDALYRAALWRGKEGCLQSTVIQA